MCNFYNLWALLRQHGSSAKKENECAQLWATFSPELQLKIFNTIKTKLVPNNFVPYDPMRAIQENARSKKQQTLSYAEYYARFHTTEPKDGWLRKYLPNEQKTIYIKP